MVQARISGAIFHLSHFRVSMKCKLTLIYGTAGRSGPRTVAGNIRRYRVPDIADLSNLTLFRNRGLAEQSLVRARQRVCHEFGDRKFLEGLHYFVVHNIAWAGSSGEIRALEKCVEAVTFNAANKPPASPA
jgi:hypothetical protein